MIEIEIILWDFLLLFMLLYYFLGVQHLIFELYILCLAKQRLIYILQ